MDHLALHVPLAHHHASDHVQARRGQVVLNHDSSSAARRRRVVQITEQRVNLLAADVLVRLDPPGAEELGEDNPARLAPVRVAG
ncbi:Os09g0441650 [Oryza sativa Japonica Group]|uniref:Os09g0441650 protein n=1 Tax=Oryza sativa subsp. japonica TaxID=39947 RepID=A0A0P0XMD3_ORYSJ|nr:hypothetical protein EE612_048126 [Oryza sativa]BAT08301.1 Os09g0441650 [Oryza sativa Japonica Group]